MKLGRPREHPEGLSEKLNVALPKSTLDRLAREAVKRGVSVASIVRERIAD